MAEETQIQEPGNVPMKRKLGQKKGGKGKKKMKVYKGSGEKVKVNKKMQKIFRKRARDYNSDDDDEVDDSDGDEPITMISDKKDRSFVFPLVSSCLNFPSRKASIQIEDNSNYSHSQCIIRTGRCARLFNGY